MPHDITSMSWDIQEPTMAINGIAMAEKRKYHIVKLMIINDYPHQLSICIYIYIIYIIYIPISMYGSK